MSHDLLVHRTVIGKAEFQGVQSAIEHTPDERVVASFSMGSGIWKMLRFGDGEKTYEITVREVRPCAYAPSA